MAIQLNANSTTYIINGTAITDFAEGDYITVTFPNAATHRTNSSNGGVTIGRRNDADVADVVCRVEKFSESDIFLNNLERQQTPVVLDATLAEAYTFDGTASEESYILTGGSITGKPVNTKNNTDGNAMMEYTIQYRQALRNL